MATLWSDRQKQRGLRLSLTWWSGGAASKTGRWRKKIDGRVVYFKHPNSAEGYESALLELAKLTAADNPNDLSFLPSSLRQMIKTPADVLGDLDKLITRDPSVADLAISVITGNPQTKAAALGPKLDEFLTFKRQQGESGSRSLGTWRTLRQNLKPAEDFLKPTLAIKAFTGQRVRDYYLHLGDRTGKGGRKLGETRKQNLFRSLKQFCLWIDRDEESELPSSCLKAFRNPDLTFGSDESPKAELLYTNAEIKTALALSPRWQAFVLLMLNCGFTQSDLSSLKRRQFNGDRLTHKRAKTRRQKNPPTLCYLLWPETLAALAKVVDLDPLKPDDLVFTTSEGNPLVSDKVIEKNGEKVPSKWDTVSKTWRDYRVAGKVANKPIKFLRKTGATALRRNREFAGVYSLYLGHAPTSVADKHYTLIDGEPFEPLDEGTAYLRQKLGIG